MNLIDLSIRRPVFAWVLMFSLIVFGAITVNRMGVSQLPDVDFPVLSISFAFEGASAGFAESFKSLTSALMIGILVAYLILAVQFNSFIHPISVLVALPFSVSGALMALWMFDVSLNLFSFIGLIVLMGIAKKNSILLVEFTNQVRETMKIVNIREALEQACPVRLRPILMTSVATVAAALPLVFGGGLGEETRIPMGLAIIGGTLVSTVLTLFVVPSLYLVLSPLESKKDAHYDDIVSS